MHAFGISLARLKIQVSDDTHAFWISWARPKIPVKWRSWRPTDRPYENFKINQTPASSQFEKKNSATYEAHQTWVDRTPEIVTKLFFMAPTIACFLSFSHVLYLKHTISALHSKTFVLFFLLWKTYLYLVVQLPKLTCKETSVTPARRNVCKKQYAMKLSMAVVVLKPHNKMKSMSPKRQNHHKVYK